MLDLSKAFDCVEYVKLFTTIILRDRRRCPVVFRLLNKHVYVQQIQVKWNNSILMQSVKVIVLNRVGVYRQHYLVYICI